MGKKNPSVQSVALDFIEQKNNKTFKILIDRLKPGLYTYAYKFVKDKDLCNEVVSQTFINIWEKIHQYNSQYNFSTWAYAIAKNEALGMLRNSNKILSHDKLTENHSKILQVYSPVYNINTECIGPTGEELIKKLYDASISAIYELEEPWKTVMIERTINHEQLHVIADKLGMNLSTVKTRLGKARKDVAKVLYEKCPDLIELYNEPDNN